jgi:hypothetical protein
MKRFETVSVVLELGELALCNSIDRRFYESNQSDGTL